MPNLSALNKALGIADEVTGNLIRGMLNPKVDYVSGNVVKGKIASKSFPERNFVTPKSIAPIKVDSTASAEEIAKFLAQPTGSNNPLESAMQKLARQQKAQEYSSQIGQELNKVEAKITQRAVNGAKARLEIKTLRQTQQAADAAAASKAKADRLRNAQDAAFRMDGERAAVSSKLQPKSPTNVNTPGKISMLRKVGRGVVIGGAGTLGVAMVTGRANVLQTAYDASHGDQFDQAVALADSKNVGKDVPLNSGIPSLDASHSQPSDSQPPLVLDHSLQGTPDTGHKMVNTQIENARANVRSIEIKRSQAVETDIQKLLASYPDYQDLSQRMAVATKDSAAAEHYSEWIVKMGPVLRGLEDKARIRAEHMVSNDPKYKRDVTEGLNTLALARSALVQDNKIALAKGADNEATAAVRGMAAKMGINSDTFDVLRLVKSAGWKALVDTVTAIKYNNGQAVSGADPMPNNAWDLNSRYMIMQSSDPKKAKAEMVSINLARDAGTQAILSAKLKSTPSDALEASNTYASVFRTTAKVALGTHILTSAMTPAMQGVVKSAIDLKTGELSTAAMTRALMNEGFDRDAINKIYTDLWPKVIVALETSPLASKYGVTQQTLHLRMRQMIAEARGGLFTPITDSASRGIKGATEIAGKGIDATISSLFGVGQ